MEASGLLTDGRIVTEGAIWDTPLAMRIPADSERLVFDLGHTVHLRTIYLQADANDRYQILISENGTEFSVAADFGSVPGHGLRSRTLSDIDLKGRYLALWPMEGDKFYSVSELVALCEDSASPTEKLKVVWAPPAESTQDAAGTQWRWNNDTSVRWELFLAVGALMFLLWPATPNEGNRRRNKMLALLGVVAGLTYFNFGSFHFGNYIHNWDAFHYYAGGKYFRELGYERLYECVAIADAEDVSRAQVSQRKLTNLRTNVLEPTTDILAHPERCKSHFSNERWLDFKRDVAFFRNREDPKRWEDLQTDHGFNATPVWAILGTPLMNRSPASHQSVLRLTMLDPLFWLAACAVIAWAFGWRVLCVGLLVFATFFPARFFWTGGSILRWDWLFYTVAAVCCLRKGYAVMGGLLLGYAMLLRIFPGVLFLGPLLLGISVWLRERRLDHACVRFCIGGAIAVALLVPLGALNAGGFNAYPAFFQNSVKHTATPLTNNMGLRTVVSYRPSEVGRFLRSNELTDPWAQWKEARLRAFDQAKLLFVLLVAGYLALLWRALKSAEPWSAAALAAMLIAVFFELTSYYYSFIFVVALLVARETRYGPWLLALTAFSCAAGIPALPFLSGWNDEQYTLISLATLLAFAAILWDFGRIAPAVEAAADKDKPKPKPKPSRRHGRKKVP